MAHALDAKTTVFLSDGGLLVNRDGLIEACDDWAALEAGGRTAGYAVTELRSGMLLIPGLIDLHVHLPQVAVTACQADTLAHWLDSRVFPEEARFAEADYAERISRWFFKQLLANGTTTAAVFLTSHPEAVRIAFKAAMTCGNRVVMGQNLMDCHAGRNAETAGSQDARDAESLLIWPTDALLAETEALCREWHGLAQGRLRYAWMPRFALSATDVLLSSIGALRRRYPDVYLHTHLSEQPSEVAAVLARFADAADYTGVYERFGLLAPRTILAHGIHLSNDELCRVHAAESALAHCPSSNFFLKSGRFRWFDAMRQGVRFGLGSDVGAGPELSLLKVMKDAQYMQADRWIPLSELFHAATLGGAEALMQADRIGNFLPGKEADFVILDTWVKPAAAMAGRASEKHGSSDHQSRLAGDEWLSRCIYLGDDRLVRETRIRGRCVYSCGQRMRGVFSSR